MEKVRIRILIEGRVQGMNFRYHTQQQATKLGLVGFVRHLSDGRIEIQVQGEEDKVDQMLDWCQAEPHGKHIKSILFRHDEPVERYTDFTVR